MTGPTREDSEFVTDLSRFAEGIASEVDIRRKYRLENEVWASLGNDDELVRAIEAEKLRRIRDGSSKRERAQLLVVKAPDILNGIMCDAGASPRHRVDAIKTLDAFAANGPEAAAAGTRFVITINLGSDVDGKPIIEHFDKSIAIDPNDVDPNDADSGVIAAIAMKKTDGGSGNTL